MPDPQPPFEYDRGPINSLKALASKFFLPHIADTRISRTPIYAAPTSKYLPDSLSTDPGVYGYYRPDRSGGAIVLNTDAAPQSYRGPNALADSARTSRIINHEQWHALQAADPTNIPRTNQASLNESYNTVLKSINPSSSVYAAHEAQAETPAFLASDTLDEMGYSPAIASQLLARPGVRITPKDALALTPSIIQMAKRALERMLTPRELRAVYRTQGTQDE